jgi:UrcA family protein
MPRTLSLIGAAALALTAVASPVYAQVLEPEQEVVRFGDLNLDYSGDADELIVRLQRAAGRVCGARQGVQPVAQFRADRDCMIETTEIAVRDVGHPMVLARYYDVNPRVIIEEGDADPYYDDGYVTVYKK